MNIYSKVSHILDQMPPKPGNIFNSLTCAGDVFSDLVSETAPGIDFAQIFSFDDQGPKDL